MILILSGRPGSGKTTLMERLVVERVALRPMISVTTRAPKPSDPGLGEYIHVPRQQFERMKARGDFAWDIAKFGNRYGTYVSEVAAGLRRKELLVATLELDGIIPLYQMAKDQGFENALRSIYLSIHDEREILRRLLERGDPPFIYLSAASSRDVIYDLTYSLLTKGWRWK
jgi:guanylate kinase